MENISLHNNNNNHNPRREASAAADDNNPSTTTSTTAVIREQDRLLPIANVGRIMRDTLPPNAKVSKEAKETMQECVSEFVAFVTAEASDKCRRERRKTVNGDDVCWALATLGFDAYAATMKRFLTRFRDFEEGNRVSAPATAEAEGNGFSNNYRDRKASVAAGYVSADKGTDGRGVEKEEGEGLMAAGMRRDSTVRMVDGGGGEERFLSFYGEQEDHHRRGEKGGTYGDGYPHLLHHHHHQGGSSSSSSQLSGDILRYFSTDERGR